MTIRSLQNPITRNAEGGDGGGGGTPDVAALVQAEVAKATAALAAKNQELLGEVKNERSKRTSLEQQLSSLGNAEDINKARELMERMQADADLRMIVEGGKPAFEDVLSRRTKGIVSDAQKQIEESRRAIEEARKHAESIQNRWRQDKLETEVSRAAARAAALPDAAEYIKMKAEQIFHVDDQTGKPVLREGVESFDRQGNPHTLETWVESLKDTNPFFFGMPQGGGANGGAGGNSGRAQVIDAKDSRAVSNSLEAIASGKAVLRT
jgi:hypothetical protein